MTKTDWSAVDEIKAESNPLDKSILDFLRKKGKQGQPKTIEDLADALDRGPRAIAESVERLKGTGYNIVSSLSRRGGIVLDAVIPVLPEKTTHDLSEYTGKWVKFGACGDKHLGNMQSRLDVMNLLYDVYAEEGITDVYDTGNWIDGECRFNKGELLVHGMDAQIQYWIEHHPHRPGITTKYVAGDDHEGWYQQREQIDIGRHAMLMARDLGRNDLVYLGGGPGVRPNVRRGIE